MLYNKVMNTLSEKEAVQIAADLLCKWLDCESSQIIYEREMSDNQLRSYAVDSIIYIKDVAYLIEFKKSGDVSSVKNGIRQLNNVKVDQKDIIKTLVVPYMHELGRKYCKEAKISWLDLSGNANIMGSGLRIIIENQPNLYKRPGRTSSVFAPKGSRVARFLLYNHPGAFTQREISKQTDLGEGYVSKIVKSMENLDLIARDERGRITSQDPVVLLDAWLEKYDFVKRNPIKGYIPARSGQSLMQHISDLLSKEGVDFAVTGLGAAWLYTHYTSFRTVTFYVSKNIRSELLSYLDFSESDVGFNTIIASPNDQSIFWNIEEIEGIQCVHPIQAFLDLKGQPERAQEAIPELKNYLLGSYLR